MEKSLYTLVNPEFQFEFGGEKFDLKKANLSKAIQYQTRVKELATENDPNPDLKIVAYCIYLVLKHVKPECTEEWVIDNTPAEIDVIECLTTLGFISPKRAETAKKIGDEAIKKATGQ